MAHMIKQTITFSDGTETVINYRGVIENGVLTPDNTMESEEVVVAETLISEEGGETMKEAEEAPAESTEETAELID